MQYVAYGEVFGLVGVGPFTFLVLLGHVESECREERLKISQSNLLIIRPRSFFELKSTTNILVFLQNNYNCIYQFNHKTCRISFQLTDFLPGCDFFLFIFI